MDDACRGLGLKISGEGVNVSRHSDLSRSVVMTCHAGLRISYWGVSARTDGGLAYGVIGRLHGAGEDAGVVGLLEETELPLSDDVQLSANDGGIACADIGEVGSSSPTPSSGRGSGGELRCNFLMACCRMRQLCWTC